VIDTLEALRAAPWSVVRVHGPIPNHKIADALKLPKSKVGYFTLAGGIIGFFTGFLFAAYTSVQWELIVSGKPVVALVPFFIVGFEFTILFSVFGNVLGLISQARLPRFDTYADYDPRFSGDRFGVLASCRAGERGGLTDLLKSQGAEIKPSDATEAEPTAS
jgi:hypothetical protein